MRILAVNCRWCVLLPLLLLVGCVTSDASRPHYSIAMRYTPTLRERETPVAADRAMNAMRELGCNAIVFDGVDQAPSDTLHRAAERVGLSLLQADDAATLVDIRIGDVSTTNILNRYHMSVSDGRSDGILLDISASSDDGQDVAMRNAAIKRLTDRAARIGPRLQGATVTPLMSADGDEAVLSCTLHESTRRAYLFLHNTSDSRFVRTPVKISGQGIQAARRVVEVPFDPHALVGEVHHVRLGQVLLPTDLAPGDARLFEVFW